MKSYNCYDSRVPNQPGALAQLVEQWPEEPRVVGSNPTGATKFQTTADRNQRTESPLACPSSVPRLLSPEYAGVAQLLERFLAKEEAQG